MADIPTPVNKRWFAVEHRAEVTVLRFIRPDMGDGEAAKAISGPMFSLVDDQGLRRFVLDFAPVGRLSSAVLGKLITFQKKVNKAGGRLTLCSLQPDLHFQFERTKLNTVFRICPTEQDAVNGVQEDSSLADAGTSSAAAPVGEDTPLPAPWTGRTADRAWQRVHG